MHGATTRSKTCVNIKGSKRYLHNFLITEIRGRGGGEKSEEEAGTKGIKEINAEVRKLL